MAHNVATTTNGGTLEDCHTNIFVLTELNGLRWCRFSSNNSSQVCTEIRDDPILCAYGKCLQQSLLCVWRRVPPNNLPAYGSRVDLRLTSDKELWVFWYGEEPAWNQIWNHNALTKDEGGGSWDKGVEYDTRCLLFKALHNLIERCLFTRDFIRLGRWFVRPLDVEEASTDSSHPSQVMAFSFSFFVHGENNVCVSVNVQSQPAVYRLTKDHLNSLSTSAASNNGDSTNKRTVILAPWSLKGILNAEDLKNDSEKQSRKREIWLEWSNFYPFPPEGDNVENMGYVDPAEKERQDQAKANSLPRVVEVTVGGVRLQYPSCFIVLPGNVVEGGEKCEKYRSNSSRNYATTTTTTSSTTTTITTTTTTALNTSIDPLCSPESPKYDSSKFQKRLVERAEEELTLIRKKSQPLSQLQSTNPTSSDSALNGVGANNLSATAAVVEDTPMWNFVVVDSNNAQKDSCHCSNIPLVMNKAQLKFYPPQTVASAGGSRRADRQTKLSKLGVFHRRSTALSSLPTSVSGFNRILPTLLSDLVTDSSGTSVVGGGGGSGSGSSQQQQQQSRDVAVTLPLLTNTNGIEAISRPSSRTMLTVNSSIQMISPAAAPTPMNHIDSNNSKPNILTRLEQNSNNADNSLPSTSVADRHQIETARTVDGTDVFVIKRPLLKPKRLAAAAAAANVALSLAKRRSREIDNVRVLNDFIDISVDESLDTQSLYAPDVFITKENCAFNEQQRKKFKLWSLTSAGESPVNKCPLSNNPAAVESSPCATDEQELLNVKKLKDASHFESLTPDGSGQPAASFAGIGHTEPSVTYQTVVRDYTEMPENFLEDDSSSGISGAEDENASNFLSPPPSHGQEDEVNARKTKASNSIGQCPATSLMPSAAHFNSQTLQNQTKSAIVGGPNGADFTIIYPTPPSVDCNVQFSPECPAGTSSWHDASRVGQYHGPDMAPTTSHVQHAFAGPLGLSRAAADVCVNDIGKIVERPITAKYLAGGKFGSLTSAKFAAYFTSNKRKPDEYRPKTSLIVGASSVLSAPFVAQQQPQASFPPHSVPRAQQQPLFNSPVQPPPPYPTRCFSYSSGGGGGGGGGAGGASTPHWSSPPSVRPVFAEQSPMTNSPMNANLLVRTPRTPATADLQSPLSNASSHYGRNVGSIDFNSVYTGGQSPEAHSLVLTLLLCETFVDLHKDVIFDSCPLCVCSTNIQGSEMGLYVPSTALTFCDPHNQLYQNAKCSCGFSAARHRYLSYKSGLFYEDEYESSGVWRCRTPPLTFDDKRFCSEVMELVRHQSLSVNLTRSISCTQSFLYRNDHRTVRSSSSSGWNGYNSSDLELNDFADLCNVAMEQACISDCTVPTREDMRAKSSLVYSWGFLKSLLPVGNAETMSLIRSLLPVLQESVQKPRGNWNAKYKVEGPLTWRQFHRKCSSSRFGIDGRDDFSGPEPVPLLLAATDREWVTTSPFALKLCDRLSLEPYGQPKDVVYIIVVPDNQLILHKSEAFFRELSKVYEGLRLGRHCPYTDVLENGIMKVGKSRVSKLENQPIDPWFDQFNQCVSSSSKHTLGSRLKAFAQVCRHYVVPHLQNSNIFERSALQKMRKESQANTPALSNDSTMPPPPAPNPSGPAHDSPSDLPGATDGGAADSFDVDNSPLPHVVVIYLVNCFTYGAETEDEEHNRLVSMGLFRSYLEMFKELPENVKGSLQLQIVPLQTILDFSLPNDSNSVKDGVFDIPSASRTSLSQSDYFRELALNVFAQSRSVGLKCMLSLQAKPLTGFGPAASRIEMIKKKMERSPNTIYQIHCPQYILAPTFEHSTLSTAVALTNNAGCDSHDDSVRVLFLTYCLSEKQRWLLAAATDQQGALLENCVINLNVPDRWCAARCTVILGALKKLLTFACSLMAAGCQPWRLIVGRMGRIGHEELKAWTHLLSKNHLRTQSRSLREHCAACLSVPDTTRLRDIHDTPSLLSACLVATETDSHFRVFSDSFSYDERFGQNAKQCPLSTPEDVSCTHIMVFPTSASIQMNQPGASNNGPGTDESEIDGLMGFFDDDAVNVLNDLLSDNTVVLQTRGNETADDNIQQQPLALGYSVSTAPVDFSSDWFWSSCPSAKYVMPAYLRSSLHINTNGVQQNDEQLFSAASKSRDGSHSHPLDSSVTTDVLRYVLETYNALSWLNLEPTTGDRRSCLPIHMQALCRLYKAVEELL